MWSRWSRIAGLSAPRDPIRLRHGWLRLTAASALQATCVAGRESLILHPAIRLRRGWLWLTAASARHALGGEGAFA